MLEFFFPTPRICPICQKPQPTLEVCDSCQQRLLYKRSLYGQCSRCHSFGSRAAVCRNCRDWPAYFQAVYSIWPYQEDYRDAVMRFKFHHAPWLAPVFAKEMLSVLPDGYDLLIPVPLHKSRLRERGYNQSLLLVKELHRLTKIPYGTALVRSRATAHQPGLSRTARLDNLYNAFNVRHPEGIQGRSVILVDDVFTTGATLRTCAAALKQAGAEKICGLTIASGID